MIDFIKMEGLGNDYIYIDTLENGKDDSPLNAEEIRSLCDRRFGIGADGVVIIAPSDRATARMKMWNADGSPSPMCGNALRCIALHVAEKKGLSEFDLESDAGLHRVKVRSNGPGRGMVEINMGRPRFAAEAIPVLPDKLFSAPPAAPPYIQLPLDIDGIPGLRATVLSMGNPHCVLFVDDADAFPVGRIGPLLENHPAFPRRSNIEFVSPEPDGRGLYQRTYERGSGETLACGSGAAAVLVAAVLAGKGTTKNKIRLRGGVLHLEWQRQNELEGEILLTGPARRVYQGRFDPKNFGAVLLNPNPQ